MIKKTQTLWRTSGLLTSVCAFLCVILSVCVYVCTHVCVCVYACQQLRGERGGGMGLEERLEKESLGLGDNPAQKALLFGE